MAEPGARLPCVQERPWGETAAANTGEEAAVTEPRREREGPGSIPATGISADGGKQLPRLKTRFAF